MPSADDPSVGTSIAKPGEVADDPESIEAVRVEDDGEPQGFLVSWDVGEWMFAFEGDYVPLNEKE